MTSTRPGSLAFRASTTRWSSSDHPDLVKLLDFETTLPKAVEDLIKAKSAG